MIIIHLHLSDCTTALHLNVNESQPLAQSLNSYIPELSNFHIVHQKNLIFPSFSPSFLNIKNDDDLFLIPKKKDTVTSLNVQLQQSQKRQKLIESVHDRFIASHDIKMAVPAHIALEGIRLRDQHFAKLEGNEREFRKFMNAFTFTQSTRRISKFEAENPKEIFYPSGPSKEAIPIQWQVLSQ